MVEIYLGLGSNLGDCRAFIEEGMHQLEGILEQAKRSSLWQSTPMYDSDQPDFINAALCGHTAYSPGELLDLIHAIEDKANRARDPHRPKGPRTLDIDILLYGDHIIDTPSLKIPHPDLKSRLFALLPLLELNPDIMIPRSNISYASLAALLPHKGIYQLPA